MPRDGKVSLFAQRMQKKREVEKRPSNENMGSVVSANVFGDRSYILENSVDADAIHMENVEKLTSMSSEELISERRRLFAEMDPGLIEFLKTRRTNQQHSCSQPALEKPSSMDTSEGTVHGDTTEVPAEVEELVNSYPNMDTVEPDKLKWIGEMPKPGPPPEDKPYNARFDFEGTLLAYADKGEGVLKGFHNHGEEQSRPGYTIQELIQLSRSSVLQQRVIALNTLAKILYNAQYRYEGCFESSLMSDIMEDPELYLLFRFSMDDVSFPVVSAAVNAMSNLIVNNTDETCLDLMLGMPQALHQPSFEIDLGMSESDIGELKDKELLKVDIIRGAIRTQLIDRISYIMCELRPEPLDIKHMLKCLTRIARHSAEAARQVVSCPGLLGAVHSLLMHSSGSTSYYPEALKFLRVLICRSSALADIIVNDHSVLGTIFTFIAGEVGAGHPELMHVTLESFYTWQSVLTYRMHTDSISSFTPVLMRFLEAHLGLTLATGSSGSDLEHAAAILSLLTPIARFGLLDLLRPLLPAVVQCTVKWLTQLLNADRILLPTSKLIGAALYLMAQIPEDINIGNNLNAPVEKLVNSDCFIRIAESFRKHSWLISGRLSKSPENLPGLGSGLVPPFLNPDSCFGVVQGVGIYAASVHASPKLASLLLQHRGIICYVNSVLKVPQINLVVGHWYAKQECLLLLLLADSYVRLRPSLPQEVLPRLAIYSRLAFLLVSTVHSTDRDLLSRIFSDFIFNPLLFRDSLNILSEKMKWLSVRDECVPSIKEETGQLIDTALNNCEGIREFYLRELALARLPSVLFLPPESLTRSVATATQPAFPADWPFLPIVGVYNKKCCGKEEKTLSLCLQYILLLEEFRLADLCPAMTPTSKYCRLACVYLAGNDFFREVSPLLGAILDRLIERSAPDLDFESPIPGLTSFYDFYRELLEQFVGVSYGDPIFGRFVLVPLAQRHNVKYKKLLWSELAPVIRFLRTPLDQVNIKDYLEPCEIDPDMLVTYLQSLAIGRVNVNWCPVLYRMAVHHVATYIATCPAEDRVGIVLKDRIAKLGNKGLQQQLTSYRPD